MKKFTIYCVAFLMALTAFTGCTSNAADAAKNISSSEVPMMIVQPDNSSSGDTQSSSESGFTTLDEKDLFIDPSCSPVLADTALCRGELTEITPEGIWVVTPVEGRNYGKDRFLLDVQETNFVTPSSEISVGDYLEVNYGATSKKDSETPISAIQINKLLPAKMCVTNGMVIEADDTHVLVEIDGNENNRVFFHISDKTQLYVSALQEKDKISVYHTGAFTRSIPPQGNALEIAKIVPVVSE